MKGPAKRQPAPLVAKGQPTRPGDSGKGAPFRKAPPGPRPQPRQSADSSGEFVLDFGSPRSGGSEVPPRPKFGEPSRVPSNGAPIWIWAVIAGGLIVVGLLLFLLLHR